MVTYKQTFSSISNVTSIYKIFHDVNKRYRFENDRIKIDWGGDIDIFYQVEDNLNIYFKIYKVVDAVMVEVQVSTTKEDIRRNQEIINYFDLSRGDLNSLLFEVKDIIENECKF